MNTALESIDVNRESGPQRPVVEGLRQNPARMIGDGIKGALRIGQTAAVVSGQGFGGCVGTGPLHRTSCGTPSNGSGPPTSSWGSLLPPHPRFSRVNTWRNSSTVWIRHAPSLFGHGGILREELGSAVDTEFTRIDRAPLASASIAQVHGARLKSGEEVVLKIQKPGVSNILLTDLNFLYVSARIVETLAPKLAWTSMSGVIQEIQRTMMEECDFVQEANNLEAFREFLDRTGNTEATVPAVYRDLSTQRVLTMERFQGCH